MARPTDRDYQHMQRTYDAAARLLQIDKNGLDTELVEQAGRVLSVSEAMADCLSFAAAAKDHFDKVAAELDEEIREQWPVKTERNPNVPKMTEAGVIAKMALVKDWRDAKDGRRLWDNMVVRFQGLQDAVRVRSLDIRKLADLAIAGYYNSSSVRERRPEDNRPPTRLPLEGTGARRRPAVR